MAASEIGPDRSSTLAEHLLSQGVPPSLLIDLLDPAGMEAALQSELAEVQTRQVLAEAVLARAVRRRVRDVAATA